MKTVTPIAILMLMIVSCRSSRRPMEFPHRVNNARGNDLYSAADYKHTYWVLCGNGEMSTNEDNADLVLVLKVKHPCTWLDNHLTSRGYEFPIKMSSSPRTGDQPAPSSSRFVNIPVPIRIPREGLVPLEPNGVAYRPVGTDGYFSFRSPEKGEIGVGIRFRWDTEDGTGGEFAGNIECVIGFEEKWAMSESSVVEVSYRVPMKKREQGPESTD